MVSHTYGLATDWIKAATVVLANGTITRCSATERPNLFWSIRGAGSSMVIVAELEFNTFAAPEEVTYFDINLVWDTAKLPQVLLDTQEFAKTMPAELTMSTTFNNDGSYLNGAYIGDDAGFRAAVQPLLAKIGAKVSSSKTVGWIDFIKHYAGVTDIDVTTATYNEVTSNLHDLPKLRKGASSLTRSTARQLLRIKPHNPCPHKTNLSIPRRRHRKERAHRNPVMVHAHELPRGLKLGRGAAQDQRYRLRPPRQDAPLPAQGWRLDEPDVPLRRVRAAAGFEAEYYPRAKRWSVGHVCELS